MQAVDLLHEPHARVAVSYPQGRLLALDRRRLAQDVGVVLNGGLDAHEGAVGLDAHALGGRDERVPCDAGLLVVRLAEAPVDHEQPSLALDGALAVDGAHRLVTVDDVGVLARKAKLLEDLLADRTRARCVEVGVLGLLPGGAVIDKTALEGLDHAA